MRARSLVGYGLGLGLGVGLSCGAANAQTNARFLIVVSGEVTPATPEVTVEVWAAWDVTNPGEFYFAQADYDLVAGDGEFTSAQLLTGILAASTPGTLAGSRVHGALIGNAICIPSLPLPGIEDNPIALASYTWTTTDFTARDVDLMTEATTRFNLLPGPGGLCVSMVPGLEPGSGSIRVVPAPGAALIIGMYGLVHGRRGRRRS